MRLRDVLTKALCISMLITAACGDDGKKKSDNDGGPDGGGSPDSISFIVVSPEDGDYVPMEGANVAFDAPGGVRTEAVTGADGLVTFDGFDWSLGAAAATAHTDGYRLGSLVNLNEDSLSQAFSIDDAVALIVYELTTDPPQNVMVSGTAAGLLDTDHDYRVNVVNVMGGSEWSGHATAEFQVFVPRDEPFVLQGQEEEYEALPSGQGYNRPVYQVAHQPCEATSEPVSGVVLDFATYSLPTSTADISFGLPARAESPVRSGFPYSFVCAENTWYCFGWPTFIDISTDGDQFDASFLWVEPDWAEGVMTMLRVNDPDTGSYLSIRYIEGYPEDGSLYDTLLDVPEWVSPDGPQTPHPLHEALEWEVFDEGVPDATLLVQRGQNYVWSVWSGLGSMSMTIPQPPSTVDTEELFGTGSLQAYLLVGAIDGSTGSWSSIARSETITLEQ